MVLKRAADLAEALYSMPPRATGHHFALSSPAAVAGPAALAPTSPVSASSSPAVAGSHLTAATAGFNGYPVHGGIHGGEYHQQSVEWGDSWTQRYHQTFSF